MNHYAEAKRLVEQGNRRSCDKAQVHATLYVGEQLEVIAGLFGAVVSRPDGPDALTREQYGMGGEHGEEPAN